MKKAFVVLLVASLAGCATNQAVLPSLEGKPRVKINKTVPEQIAAQQPVQEIAPAAGRINFSFDGDVLDALMALKKVQPQLNLLPPLGKPYPFHVTLNLSNATAEDVLRAIGEQGGEKVDITLNKTQHQGGNQVVIRFNKVKE